MTPAAIVPTPRNMDDETILALAAKSGVIQVTAVHSFVEVDPPAAAKAQDNPLRMPTGCSPGATRFHRGKRSSH